MPNTPAIKKKKRKLIVVSKKQMATHGSSQQEHTTWDVDDLQPHPRQAELFPGLNPEQIQDLIRDIETNGLQQPLEILPSGIVISGHQRLRAIRRLGWEQVQVIVRHDLQAAGEEAVMRRLIEANLNRQHLSRLQLARACKVLFDLEPKGIERRGQGELNERIGKRYGYSGKTVERLLKLLELPVELQRAIECKMLPESRALALMQLPAELYEPVLNQLRDGHHIRRTVNKLLIDKRERPVMTIERQKRQWRDWLATAVALDGLQEALEGLLRPDQEPKLLAGQRLIARALAFLSEARREAG